MSSDWTTPPPCDSPWCFQGVTWPWRRLCGYCGGSGNLTPHIAAARAAIRGAASSAGEGL